MHGNKAMHDFREQLEGKRLTTVEILYHMPDHPSLIQSYVWQTLDTPPRFPRLQRFLTFWHDNIDARLHSVKMTAAKAVRGTGYRQAPASAVLTLNDSHGDALAAGPDALVQAVERLWRHGVPGADKTIH
jgi:uncharacterized protein Usg